MPWRSPSPHPAPPLTTRRARFPDTPPSLRPRRARGALWTYRQEPLGTFRSGHSGDPVGCPPLPSPLPLLGRRLSVVTLDHPAATTGTTHQRQVQQKAATGVREHGGVWRAPRSPFSCLRPPSFVLDLRAPWYDGRDQTDQHPPLSLVYARPAPGFEPREVEKEKPLRLHPNMGVGGGARFTSVGGYVVNYVTQNKPPPPSPLRARAEGAIETSPGARTRALASHTPEM